MKDIFINFAVYALLVVMSVVAIVLFTAFLQIWFTVSLQGVFSWVGFVALCIYGAIEADKITK